MNTLVTIRNDTGQATSLNRTYIGIMFIDIVRHPLSPTQQAAIPTEWGEVVSLKEGPWLTTPPDEDSIFNLAGDLVNLLERRWAELPEGERMYVHLPVGSPPFMFVFAQRLGGCEFSRHVTLVFSHTKRNVTEDGDGNKTSRFDFVRFLEFPSGWQVENTD